MNCGRFPTTIHHESHYVAKPALFENGTTREHTVPKLKLTTPWESHYVAKPALFENYVGKRILMNCGRFLTTIHHESHYVAKPALFENGTTRGPTRDAPVGARCQSSSSPPLGRAIL